MKEELLIEELTDKILKLFQRNEAISWRDFWVDICGYREPPEKNNIGYYSYIGKRLRLKDQINTELVARSDARRLECINTKGLKLVSENIVGELYAEKRIRKCLNAHLNSISMYEDFLNSDNLPEHDRRMFKRLGGVYEFFFNSLLGTCARMRLLPKSAKTRLLMEYGEENSI